MNESECDYRDEPIEDVGEPATAEVWRLADQAAAAGAEAEDAGDHVERQLCFFNAALTYLLAAGEDAQLAFPEVVRLFLLHIGFSTEANDETDTDVGGGPNDRPAAI